MNFVKKDVISEENNGYDILVDYLFHYNIYQGRWFAFHRDDYDHYFNGTVSIYNIIGDNSIEELVKRIKEE